ncbi:MAG: response regulator [Magnetococcales bacterium]|nr:response regulator [Magnetococcales bacterium]
MHLTEQEQAWLAANPRIRLGDDFSWPPFVFIDHKGHFSGISAGYVHALSHRLGITFEPIQGLTWVQALEKIKQGEIDMLPAVARSPEREKFLHFTEPFISFPVVIAVHQQGGFISGLDSLAGQQVGVVRGYITHERLQNEHPELSLQPFDSLADGLQALEQRHIAAMVDNLGAMSYEIRRLRLAQVKIAAPTPYTFELSMAVRKDWPELAALLDRGLQAMSSQEKSAIENTWLAVEVRFGIDLTTLLIWAIPLTIAALIVIAVVTIWNQRLQREIAVRKRAEEEMSKSVQYAESMNQYSRSLIDASLDPLVTISAAGRITDVNSATEQVTGVSRAQLIGSDFSTYFTEPDKAESGYLEVFDKGYVTDYPLAIRHQDGHITDVLYNASLYRNTAGEVMGVFAAARDITARKRDQAYRQRNELRLNRLLALNQEAPALNESELCNQALDIAVEVTGSSIGYLHLVNEDQESIRLVTWNKQAMELCQAAHESHYPISSAGIWADAFRQRTVVIHNDYPNTAHKRGYPEGHFPVHRHMSAPVMEGERVYMILGVGNKPIPYDQSDAKQLQLVADETQKFILRKRAVTALREARLHAEAASAAKSAFLANMSHEIRTPMNAILGMADLLWESQLSTEQRNFVQVFRSAGENLLSVINDILDFSKIEAGHLQLENISFPVAEEMRVVCEIMAMRANAKGLQLQTQVQEGVPEWVQGDPTRFRQIFLNLLSNAIKFTERGSIHFTAERVDPPDTATPTQLALLFRVRDSGIGIPEERIKTIFDHFVQVDSSITRRFGGTGLGLAIVRRLVEAMQGHLAVTSQPGMGTEFCLTIPFAFGTPPRPLSLLNLSGIRVLIVDDNAANRLLFREILEQLQASVTEADHGQAALTALEQATSAGQPFHLVLLDVRMPGMDGFQVLACWRAAGHPGTPILLLTSEHQDWHLQRCQELQVQYSMVKPVRRLDLIQQIEQVLTDSNTILAGTGLATRQQPLRILLVDDSEDNRVLVQAYLKHFPCELLVAENGAVALQLMTANRPDMVFMDVQMPVMDGYAATRTWRRLEEEQGWPRLPIIALTAYAMAEDIAQSQEAGCDSHLTKPVKKKSLLELIKRYTP